MHALQKKKQNKSHHSYIQEHVIKSFSSSNSNYHSKNPLTPIDLTTKSHGQKTKVSYPKIPPWNKIIILTHHQIINFSYPKEE